MPRQEPVRPIDPGAWVAHTAAVRGKTQSFNVLLWLVEVIHLYNLLHEKGVMDDGNILLI